MTSFEMMELYDAYNPERIDVDGVVISDHVMAQMENVARTAYELYLDEEDEVFEFRSSGIDVPGSFDEIPDGARRRHLDLELLAVRVLLQRGYVLSEPDGTFGMAPVVIERAIHDVAEAYHDDWGARVKERGVTFMIYVMKRPDGSLAGHPGLVPFDYMGFFDPDETRPERVAEMVSERAGAQAPHVKPASRSVRALAARFVIAPPTA